VRLTSANHPEFIADAVVHAVGISFGVIGAAGLLTMVASSGNLRECAAIGIYAIGLLSMLGCSAAYHIARSSPRRTMLRRLDHAAIFLMIAGTYTPFTILRLKGFWGFGMTVFVWSVAAIGIVGKLWRPARFEAFSTALYLALGWSALLALYPLLHALKPSTLVLIGVGGLLYTVGVIFHLWERLPFRNAIWHGFVLVAASVHFAAVLNETLYLSA
jgi:hemolysin III